MLVIGDLACPNKEYAMKLKRAIEELSIFNDKYIICNFEGMISNNEGRLEEESLFNDISVLEAFLGKKVLFSLANNHTYDYPYEIENTIYSLKKMNFAVTGIQENMHEIIPKEINYNGNNYAVFTHCWKVYTRTNPNKINKTKIYDCEYEEFYQAVKKYKLKYINYKVICYFHWNYDLEELPLPMHRKLAKKLIDIGVDAVIGNHSHCPQGGELYKGKPIVYGLGNFYLPSGTYFNGTLIYPSKSKITMALEIKSDGQILCHWFETDCKEGIKHYLTEDFNNGELINKYSPYRNMNDDEYYLFFKKNRKKKFLVPTFKNPFGIRNKIDTNIAIARIKLIKKLL
ncbi:TPA: CapA family protein [Clostridium perfringens]|uniref:CapA family protein n=1 Tax=Clostridium perfringens TaxID=1502 RepID=UPI002AC5B784|nr:CapA family protein [Clostridium perfringens]MDZ4964578.1 hypothetical protein [Clostridium perfringens]MDZ5013098.1 hypothetical protein [Clostridium perfringens]